MRITSEVFIIAGLMVLVVLFLMAMFARLYAKPDPTKRWWCTASAALGSSSATAR